MFAKRGQVTVLVIIGIILLFSVVLILSINSYVVNKQLETQAKQNINDFLQVNAINYYVTSCLDRVASEGLELLTKQGGYIYDYQGGLINTSNFKEGINYLPYNITYTITNESGDEINITEQINVSYLISDRFFCPAFYLPLPINFSDEETSYYPAKRLHFSQYNTRFSHSYSSILAGCNGLSLRIYPMSGFLGKNNLPKLYSYNGSNRLSENDWGGNYHYFEIKGENTSIQRQLEYYVKSNLRKCVDFDYFTENLTAYNITVDQNKTKIKTVFQNPKGILVKAEFPFSVSVAGKKPIIKQVGFETTLDIGIKQLYSFIYGIIKIALNNPNFNYLQNYILRPHYIPSYHFNLIRNACETNCELTRNMNDDILKITDDSSRLHGKPLTFYFAIKQRKPILDYLHDDTQATYFNGEPIDYLFFVNSTIALDPLAIDPDFDNITYNYSGWKETYDQWFNYSCCQANDCGLNNHTMCFVNLTNQPRNWTLSNEFIQTKRKAIYKTNNSDVGYHEVYITVTDEHGAKDYQKVRILVFDLPVAKLKGENPYDDVNNNYSSIEDEYVLNGEASHASALMQGNLSKLIFFDTGLPHMDYSDYYFYYNISAEVGKKITLPYENHSFSNITLMVYSNESLNSPVPTNHTIRHPQLIVAQNNSGVIVYSAPTKMDLYLGECLVHGYNNNTHSYNISPVLDNNQIYHWYVPGNSVGNLTYAPHVCCNPLEPDKNASEVGWGTRYGTSKRCLNINFFTAFPLEKNHVFVNQTLIDINISDVEFVNESNYGEKYGNSNFNKTFFSGIVNNGGKFVFNDSINDIFAVNVTQSCSGLRGNTCGGTVTARWDVVHKCNDLNSSINQFARCQGPSVSYENCVGKYVPPSDSLKCHNYTQGENWETAWLKNKNPGLFNEFAGDNVSLIENGFCAPNHSVKIETNTEGTKYFSTTFGAGAMTCGGSCNGEGTCDFELNKDCVCNASGSSDAVCNGLKAKDLFTWNPDDGIFSTADKTKFVCYIGDNYPKKNTACGFDCNFKSYSLKEACWCRTHHNSSSVGTNFREGTTYEALNSASFDSYFNKERYTGINNDMCCVEGNVIVKKSPPGETRNCYNGTTYSSPSIVSGTQDHLLSCNGNLLSCCSPSNQNCGNFLGWDNNLIIKCDSSGCTPSNVNKCGYNCKTQGNTENVRWQYNYS